MSNMVKVKDDLTGRVFDRLTVIEQAEDHIKPNGTHIATWKCKCNCSDHNIVEVIGQSLKSGATQSCGCLHIEKLKQYNKYDYSKEYGVGYCSNTGAEFYFDWEDFDKIKNYCWSEYVSEKGYHSLRTHIPKTHQVIKFCQLIVDYDLAEHKDRNPLNNRKSNLRPATIQENCRNRTISIKNNSGFVGVYFDKDRSKWVATITVDYKQIKLGRFINKEDAIKTRLKAELKYFGLEFAPQRHLFKEYGICEVEPPIENDTE